MVVSCLRVRPPDVAPEPAALIRLKLKHHGIFSCINQLKIDVSTLCLAHLLSALAPSLNIYIPAHYRDVLPAASFIFGLLRDKIVRSN